MKQWKLLILFLCCGIIHLSAQRALPGFTLQELSKGKVSISWINPYPSCNQLAVQRSTDGINFRTIFSAQSPELPRNGYVDNKVPSTPKVYYRLFYVLAGGNYFFSAIKSPSDNTQQTEEKEEDISSRINIPADAKKITLTDSAASTESSEKKIRIYQRGKFLYELTIAGYRNFRDSIIQFTQDSLALIKPGEINWKPLIAKPKEYVSVFVKDTLLIQIELPFYKRFKDSVIANTKDTLTNITTFRAELSRFIPKQVWKPSVHVYTNSNGYLTISVPAHDVHSYRIVFYDAEGMELFRIPKVKEAELVLDKANFKRSGWFNFELFKHNELIEKNKFFLQKD